MGEHLRPCSTDGCNRKAVARLLCASHYRVAERADKLPGRLPIDHCSEEGCTRAGPFPKGWCSYHYRLAMSPEVDVTVPSGFPDPGPRVLTQAQVEIYANRPPRTCSHCGEVKPATEFYASRTKVGRRIGEVKLKSICRRCYYYHRPTGNRYKADCAVRELQKLYKITPDQRAQMAADQGGLCAICRRKPVRVIDHNHRTGFVRGLLCQSCNTSLHMIEDNDLLQSALKYLAREAEVAQ